MKITSPVFKNNKMIPRDYTCEGANYSPPLEFSQIPGQAVSLVLLTEDPDAPGGTFVHWVLFNLPPAMNGLGANVSDSQILPNGAHQGRNDFGQIGYGGPCPPSGVHRYIFKLYALDQMLEFHSIQVTHAQVFDAMKGHVLAQAELTGKYEKQVQKKQKQKLDQEVEQASIESFPASDPPSWTTGIKKAS